MAVVEGRRPLPPQCSNPEGARYLNSHWKYLSWLGLQEYMENLCKKLLSKPKLPRNPYTGFVQHLHQQAQRMHLESSVSVQRLGRDVSFSSYSGVKWSISDTGGSSPVWGLPVILRYVDPESVAQYTWLIHDATFPLSSFRNARPYTVQVLPALTGSCIFSGTFFLMPPSVDILQILVVIGPDVDRAIELYSQSVLEDLTRLINQRRHLIYRICVPVDEGSKVEIFTETDLKIRAAEFQSCVQHAAHCRKQVRAECLWRIDPTGSDFQRGSKGYDLSVIQTGQGLGEERVIDFSGCPLQHLFSSLFLQRSHAEAYVGLFMPRRELVNPGVLSSQTSQAGKSYGKMVMGGGAFTKYEDQGIMAGFGEHALMAIVEDRLM